MYLIHVNINSYKCIHKYIYTYTYKYIKVYLHMNINTQFSFFKLLLPWHLGGHMFLIIKPRVSHMRCNGYTLEPCVQSLTALYQQHCYYYQEFLLCRVYLTFLRHYIILDGLNLLISILCHTATVFKRQSNKLLSCALWSFPDEGTKHGELSLTDPTAGLVSGWHEKTLVLEFLSLCHICLLN